MKTKLSDFKNNRIYSQSAINNALDKSKNNNFWGYLSHPDTLDELSQISHVIKKLEVFDDGIYGEIILLNTPKGKIAKEIEKYTELGVSERCIGVVDPITGITTVTGILSYDLVIDNNDDILKRRRQKIEKIMCNIKNGKL